MEQRALEITIVSVRHLPKTDTLGACDPYVSLEFDGTTQQTSVKKRTYSADYNEIFTFLISGQSGPLVLSLYDWNMATSNAKIGSNHVSWEDIRNILLQPLGFERNMSFKIYDAAKTVIGNDKVPTEVNIRIRTLSALKNNQIPHVDRRRVG